MGFGDFRFSTTLYSIDLWEDPTEIAGAWFSFQLAFLWSIPSLVLWNASALDFNA